MNFDYMNNLLLGIWVNFINFFKHNPVIKAFGGVIFFFTGIKMYIGCVLFLVMFDVITGIYAAVVNGEGFTSKILRKGLLEKFVLYLILLCSSAVMEALLKSIYSWDANFVAFFMSILIATYEMVSICENILKINPRLTFLKSLIGISYKVQKGAIKFVEKKIDDAELPDLKEHKKEDEKASTIDEKQ